MKPPRRRLKKSVKRTLWGILCVIIVIMFVHHHNAQKTTTTRSTAAQASQTTPKKAPSAQKTTPTVKTTATPTAAEKAAVRQQLTKKWQAILDQQTTKRPVSIAVYSKKYNETITLNSSKSSPHITASIIKVAMITQLLHQHKANHAKLSTAEISYAEGAIENSNNTDATALYHAIGRYGGLNSLFTSLNMTSSQAGSSGWASATTTATDQVKLLNQIFYNGTYLSTKSQTYVQGLMRHVESDQNWGISAGSKAYQLKNGWRLTGNNTWVVNSIGHLGSGTNSCTIAILTNNNTTLKRGISYVEQFAKATGDTLDLTGTHA
ncbi:hypothetical protein [Loigolactobacillus bifermentans]|uniref:Beta-lactamase class a n=1 Tax=Loigolactobacillus bifermentans DSM 20003 TaxID=1423726 RepID=A0A0R1H1Q4_9LACO|nr:hypothetical protein [Loigolactobacillus bifermentans]KRK40414.1 beta-lactamase class a [Loigolactobacillus bifermentans DSM 20003]QGG61031.1 penicillin-binding protein [Loigolactobacillus bifermentans]